MRRLILTGLSKGSQDYWIMMRVFYLEMTIDKKVQIEILFVVPERILQCEE